MRNKSARGPWVIIIAALALMIVILILGNLSFRASEKTAFDEFNRRQLVLAQEAASGIELYFEILAGDMRALGRIPEVQRLDEALTRREIRHTFDKLEPLGVNDIEVLGADGVLRYNVTAPQIEGVDFSWREYYQQAQEMSSSDVYVVEFIEFKGVDVGQKGVLVAVPMFEIAADSDHPSPSGQFAGVVVCTLKLDIITQRFVAPVQSSERGHALLIDDGYDVLWSPDSALFGLNILEESAEFPAFQQTLESMAAGGLGAAEYVYYEFEDSSAAFARDKKKGQLMAYAPIQLGSALWSLGVWAPKGEVEELLYSSYLRQLLLVGVGLLAVFAGSALAVALSLRHARSLEREVEAQAGELKESHQRLLTVLDSLDAVVYVADMETHEVLFANKQVQKAWGDVVGKTCWQVLQTGQSGPCEFCTNDKLLTAKGKPGGVHSWATQNTVNKRWYEIRDRAIHWVDGRIVRLEIAIDTTERKQARDALYESEERYRRLVDLSPDAIAIQCEDKIVFVNDAGVKLFGVENSAQLVGKSVWDFALPEHRATVLERYRQVRDQSSQIALIQQRFARLDGTLVDVEVTAIPTTYQDKPAIQAIFRNVTQCRQAEQALEGMLEFQQTIIDGVTMPIMVIGTNHQVKLMNRAAREFWPGDDETAKTARCYQLSHGSEKPCSGLEHPCPLEQVRETGQPVALLHEHHLASGERRLVEVTATPLWGADGAFQGIIESMHDVTGHKGAEDALEHQVQSLARSNEDLEQFAYKVVKSLQDFFEKLPPD